MDLTRKQAGVQESSGPHLANVPKLIWIGCEPDLACLMGNYCLLPAPEFEPKTTSKGQYLCHSFQLLHSNMLSALWQDRLSNDISKIVQLPTYRIAWGWSSSSYLWAPEQCGCRSHCRRWQRWTHTSAPAPSSHRQLQSTPHSGWRKQRWTENTHHIYNCRIGTAGFPQILWDKIPDLIQTRYKNQN